MTQVEQNERGTCKIVVVVEPRSVGRAVVEAGSRLARALKADWEALYVETPADIGRDQQAAADALRLASELGATVTKLSAASVATGVHAHLENSPANHLVVGYPEQSRSYFSQRDLITEILSAGLAVEIHVILTPVSNAGPVVQRQGSPASYAVAIIGVAFTAVLALLLRLLAGVQYLSFLFLFPVIAAAARLGIKPAIAAAVACSVAFNLFFISPAYSLKVTAIQSWIMTAALVLVAVYTGALTGNLRGRALLSERSAQESASVASLGSELARAADWDSTARVICSDVSALLDVQTVLVREVAGSLRPVAGFPHEPVLDPLDRAALEWAWDNGVPTGSGTAAVSAATWRFEPLKTSLATLAVLGLARTDGREPVPAERKVLLSTVASQSALALERLRLEDLMKTAK